MKQVITRNQLYTAAIFLAFALIANPVSTLANAKNVVVEEICDNRIDDDGDGLVDCLDPDCADYNSCWICQTEFYQIHSNSTLVSLDPTSGDYKILASISGAQQINGAQFNHLDGHVYAPSVIDGVQKLAMLSQDGTVTPLDVELPGSQIFYCGAISADGVMYLANNSGLIKVDLMQEDLVVEDTGVSSMGVADFSLDIQRGLFYGVTGKGQLKVFDPFSLQVSTYDLAGSINNEYGAFGAAWSCNDGSFFTYNNKSGKIYSINVNTLTATQVLNATGNLSINDGFNCVTAPPPFESDCTNGIDDDGDGFIDCDDPDCYTSNECTVEICDNGIDDDNDGWIDCNDSECFALSICIEICDNGVDDNGNGLEDSEDPQCSTSSGVTGGLESNRRLSEKIANRNYFNKVIASENFEAKEQGLIPFVREAHDQKSKHNIAQFIPTDYKDYFASESTPDDLLDITNAVDVAAADYYNGSLRVASVLALYTESSVYEHTKYICDRLDGSRLLDISYLFMNGGNFISYELLNRYGQQEYAVSFSAHHQDGEGFYIENHWNLHKYSKEKDFYNFQIWASSYDELITLLESVLTELESVDIITDIVHSEIPKEFVMQGDYQNGELRLVIKNKTKKENLHFKSNLSRSEGGDLKLFETNVNISGSFEEVIYINTGHLFDLGATLGFGGNTSDEIFLADGAWGIDDQNQDLTINAFETFPELGFYGEDVYQIERGVRVDAKIKDYLNIYRSLDAKFNSIDLEQFDNLVFNAKGKGIMQITIVKASVAEWEQQFRTSIELTEDLKFVNIHKEDFTSPHEQELDMSDVTMLVFTLLGDSNESVTKNVHMSNMRFENSLVSSNERIEMGVISSAFPNPFENEIEFAVNDVKGSDAALSVYNADGMRVYEKTLNLEGKITSEKIDLSVLPSGIYFYRIVSDVEIIDKGKIIKLR